MKSENTTNDGVKILEEVFGKSPTEVTSEETPSVSSSEDVLETKANPEEVKKPAEIPANPASFGPTIPTEDDFDAEEIKKAEEHKTQGNTFFKGE